MPESNSSQSLPKAEEILAGISHDSKEFSARIEEQFLLSFREDAVKSQIEYAHLEGIKDHYRHKGKWSWFLMFVIGGMVIFQSILLALVGWGTLDFTKYKWLLPVLLVQNLAQVVGLAVWAVKYLFSDITNQRHK